MKLQISDFAKLFGVEENNLPNECLQDIKKMNTTISPIVGEELKILILKILKKIDGDEQKVGNQYRKNVWFKGWEEILKNFRSNKSYTDLKPKFLRENQPIRWDQGYYKPSSHDFEKKFQEIFAKYLFFTYMNDVKNIYEFGAGTGYNLVLGSKCFPHKNFFGSDFVQSAVDLINLIAQEKKMNLRGDLFDMINPDQNYIVKKNSAVLTMGALEQLSGHVKNMFDYLLHQKPDICIHSEPEVGFYDQNILEDYLALKFQKKRGYTNVISSYLKKLESEGKIKILKMHRIKFGSLFMEGYNLFVWKVLNAK